MACVVALALSDTASSMDSDSALQRKLRELHHDGKLSMDGLEDLSRFVELGESGDSGSVATRRRRRSSRRRRKAGSRRRRRSSKDIQYHEENFHSKHSCGVEPAYKQQLKAASESVWRASGGKVWPSWNRSNFGKGHDKALLLRVLRGIENGLKLLAETMVSSRCSLELLCCRATQHANVTQTVSSLPSMCLA